MMFMMYALMAKSQGLDMTPPLYNDVAQNWSTLYETTVCKTLDVRR